MQMLPSGLLDSISKRTSSHFTPTLKGWALDWQQEKMDAKVDVPLVLELHSTLRNLRASVDDAHQKLPQGLELLRAFMKETYPGRRTIGVSPKKGTG
jgi:hypothetical protein